MKLIVSLLILFLSVSVSAQQFGWKGNSTDSPGYLPCFYPKNDEDVIRNLKHYLNNQYRKGVDLSFIFKKKSRGTDNRKSIALDFLRGKKSVSVGAVIKVINKSDLFRYKHYFLISLVNEKDEAISRYVMSDRGEVFADIAAPEGKTLAKCLTTTEISNFVKTKTELRGRNLRFKRVFYRTHAIYEAPCWEAFDINGVMYLIDNPDKLSDKPRLYKIAKRTKWTVEARIQYYRNLKQKDSGTKYIIDKKNNKLLTLKEI